MRLPVSIRYALRIAALPLLAIAVALIAFVWGSQPGTTEAATNGAAMSLRVDASQTVACPGGPVAGEVCVVGGQTFDVIVVADAIPLTNGYILAQAYIAYGNTGLVQKKTDGPFGPTTNATMIWPDGEPATFLTAQFALPATSVGALTQLLSPHPPSFNKGDLFSIELTCTGTQSSHSIEIRPSGDVDAKTSGAVFTEFGTGTDIIPSVTGIQVNCVTAMSLRVDASQTTDCPGGPVAGEVCVGFGQKFDVIVVADAIPSNGYFFAQAWIDYDSQGLVHKKNSQLLWPDCEPSKFLPSQNAAKDSASANCATAFLPPPPRSDYKGDLYSFSMTCTAGGSSSQIDLIPFGQAPAGADGALYKDTTGIDFIPSVTGIQVNCVPPPPTPVPVGGIVVDPELRALPLETPQPSEPSAGMLGVIAMAVSFGAVVVLGAALSARRRGWV